MSPDMQAVLVDALLRTPADHFGQAVDVGGSYRTPLDLGAHRWSRARREDANFNDDLRGSALLSESSRIAA